MKLPLTRRWKSPRKVSRQQTANQRTTSKTIGYKKTCLEKFKWGQVEGFVYGGLPNGESPLAPVYEDGKKTVTLKGDRIAEEFQGIVHRYIETHYGVEV